MAALPWFKWFPKDFAADTKHLDLLHRGAYRELLDNYYLCDGLLPRDPITLYRICGAISKAEQRAIDQVVEEFFSENGDYLRNPRSDLELKEMRLASQSLALRGKAGANARWNGKANPSANATANASAIPQAFDKQCLSNADTDSDTDRTIKPLRVVPDTAFLQFWETWPSGPRKVGKAKCAEVWKRRSLAAIADKILEHVASMKQTDQWKRGYDPAPLTYLNQSRWEDGPPSGREADRSLAV